MYNQLHNKRARYSNDRRPMPCQPRRRRWIDLDKIESDVAHMRKIIKDQRVSIKWLETKLYELNRKMDEILDDKTRFPPRSPSLSRSHDNREQSSSINSNVSQT